jgi:hypothetical protein
VAEQETQEKGTTATVAIPADLSRALAKMADAMEEIGESSGLTVYPVRIPYDGGFVIVQPGVVGFEITG